MQNAVQLYRDCGVARPQVNTVHEQQPGLKYGELILVATDYGARLND